ncbi:hypothetical protein M409DRAFT_56316 [Zasmidium cellare ATCC 36951]|uniref:Peptidase A1 domain-containing protein n=1 Tax=Zasmidium cellare ATCC 36951 TaxID=1080233 RepID=A0A6A6CFN3_ZASCE|nr:uncharacterized protein M409DRAFT_56316 [Zasmidium cellare ATCC 36951]KAF2164968.1 hypothetical protein M409DRAFT_56316 [Zasmidium cellare ATCC 36951]
MARMHRMILLASIFRLSCLAVSTDDQAQNDLSVHLSVPIDIGEGSSVPARHQLFRLGKTGDPDVAVTCLDCGVSGGMMLTVDAKFDKTPELDKLDWATGVDPCQRKCMKISDLCRGAPPMRCKGKSDVQVPPRPSVHIPPGAPSPSPPASPGSEESVVDEKPADDASEDEPSEDEPSNGSQEDGSQKPSGVPDSQEAPEDHDFPHDPATPSNIPPGLDGTVDIANIELPITIDLGNGMVAVITEGTEPFEEMTEATRAALQAWRTSNDPALKAAMAQKGAILAAQALAFGGLVAENGQLPHRPPGPPGGPPDTEDPPPPPPPEDEDCDNPWNDLVEKLSGKPPIKKPSIPHTNLALRNILQRSLQDQGSSSMFDIAGDWIRSLVSSVTFQVEATTDLTASYQIELFTAHDLKLGIVWDWFGMDRFSYTTALSLAPKQGSSLSWKPETKYTKVDKSNKVKAPWPSKFLPKDGAKQYETKLGTLEYAFAPFSLDAKIGAKGNTNMTLPGFTAIIPKGSIFAVDLLGDEILQNTFSPEIISLPAQDHNNNNNKKEGKPNPEEFSLSLSLSLGTKAELKLLPGLHRPKKPKNKCIESFTQALKWLAQAAAAKTFDSAKKVKDTLPLPKWLNRKGIKEKGFGDPLSIGARLDWARMDFKVKQVSDVDSHCEKDGPIQHGLQMQSIFRQGFTPYANLFFWKADTSLGGKMTDKWKDGTAGLFMSKSLGKFCYDLHDTHAALGEMGNVTETASGASLGEGDVDGEVEEEGEMGEFAREMWREEMAMGANDTVRVLAPMLGVQVEDVGVEGEHERVEYVVEGEEREGR